MALEVSNQTQNQLTYEEALHTYFAVSDIRNVSVDGLEGTAYIDKTDNFSRKIQPGTPLQIAKETDQVHLNTTATCIVSDTESNRRIVIEKTGSNSTVVWNPWIAKTAGMADMGPDEWQRMICIETANAADNAITLAPGESHRLTATISLG
jgi:glucose-6-phosphate 1-epimerase